MPLDFPSGCWRCISFSIKFGGTSVHTVYDIGELRQECWFRVIVLMLGSVSIGLAKLMLTSHGYLLCLRR